MKVTISVEAYDIRDVRIVTEVDDTGSTKKDLALIDELLTETAQAVRRSYDIADPF
jgi:hypothetical protein